MYKQAFSLVELSIVLVILGLLTGGILTGQNLIRAAELRGAITEFKNYQTATMTFRDKYFYYPGDMPNATNFWGAVGGGGVGAACFATESTDTTTCNGNGNGEVFKPDSAADNWLYAEQFSAWKHLANAGLIEGAYTGVSDSPTHPNIKTPGKNTPISKINPATYGLVTQALGSGSWFTLGGLSILLVQESAQPLVPEEAWNIDTKLDDGKPGTGRVTSQKSADCVSSTTDENAAIYLLQTTTKECSLAFIIGN